MFTSDEIREINFQKSGMSGYKAADVDEFCDQVADDFFALENSNRELVEKIKVLAAHIEELRENEESVKTCMINAQITADRSIREAEKKSKSILEEANKKADALVSEAESKSDYIYEETKRKTEEFLTAAKEKADEIISEAENQAIVLRNETDKKINIQKQAYERLKSEILLFRDSSIETCMKQLELLKNVSDSELILDYAANEDATNEDFSSKLSDSEFVPKKDETTEEKVDKTELKIDEIKEDEEDDSPQGSFFEYKQ